MKVLVEDYEVREVPDRHPSVFEPTTLILGSILGLLGVIIGLEVLTRVGIAPNSSVIGAIIAIAVSRIPRAAFQSFRSIPRQNLMQTVISGATYGGANGLLLPMGVLWLMGRLELVPAMLLGAFLGLSVGATVIYLIFDSRLFPAGGLWPSGVATAECIIAGDQGGNRAKLLGVGGLIGCLGQALGYPMDVFGVCWIGNIWALTMFGVGLLVRGYSLPVLGIDLDALYVPHGIMIGAGLVALAQVVLAFTRRSGGAGGQAQYGVSERDFARNLGGGTGAFVVSAAILAAVAGLFSEMSIPMLIGLVCFAGAAAIVSDIIAGISAMHTGWFPAFAMALIFLVLGMAIGFPPLALAFLTGFTASTGPAFADMGYDLKAGWILRGSGKYAEFERQGRRQQYIAELFGFVVAAAAVFFFYDNYFANDMFPPVDRVYVATIAAGTTPGLALNLLRAAVVGAVIQLVGGRSRQTGVLFATGLLIYNPVAGWTALVSLAVRALLVAKYGEPIQSPMYVLAGGFIAGSAVTSFGTATLKVK